MVNFFNLSYIIALYAFTIIILAILVYRSKQGKSLLVSAILAIFAIIIDLCLFQFMMYKKVTFPREKTAFSEYPSRYEFPKNRIRNFVSDDAFNNFRPALYKKHVALNNYTLAPGFFKESKVESIYVKLNIYDSNITFYNDLNRLTIKQFINYGFENIGNWPLSDRLLFLEILQAVAESFDVRHDFYIEHVDIARMTGTLAETFGHDAYALLVPDAGQKERSKILNTLMSLFDMSESSLYAYKNSKSIVLNQNKDFTEPKAFYKFLYNNISAKEYLMFCFEYRVRPGQIFVLLNDYYRLIKPQGAFNEFMRYSAILPDNVMDAIGVSEPIIRYYSGASFLPQEQIVANIRDVNKSSYSRLYLESNSKLTEGNVHPEAGNNFSYKILQFNSNLLSLSYSAPKEGYLYYSDCYDTYWNAYVDSKKTNVYKANVAFKAIKIPAGTHKVKFSYDPIYFRISLWFYYITFFLCSFYLIIGAFNRPRKDIS